MKNRTVEEIASDLLQAKGEMKAAKEIVESLEQEIAAQLDSPDEGSKTHTFGCFKAVVKRGVNIKADIKGMATCGATFWPVSITAPKQIFDKKLWASMQTEHPDDVKLLNEFITETPAKTSITLSKVAE